MQSRTLRMEPGVVIGGKYRLLHPLASGGMGMVFEAANTLTRKHVAIKILHDALGDEEPARRKLLREAAAAARVHHPNVVDVYDVVIDGDVAFLVMELLAGETLADRFARGPLSLAELLPLVMPAMAGVLAGHERGLYHRDIKPENIFLARFDARSAPIPKVLDFGISKALDSDDLTNTRVGLVSGTPHYMAPERVLGDQTLRAQIDVYAFGVVLYQGLSGRPPFDAETLGELALRITQHEPTRLSALRPELPSGFVRVVERAMAKDPERRTPTLDLLIAELKPFLGLEDAPVHGPLATPRPPHIPVAPRRSLWLGGLTLLGVLTVLGALRALSARPVAATPRSLPPQLAAGTASVPNQAQEAAQPVLESLRTDPDLTIKPASAESPRPRVRAVHSASARVVARGAMPLPLVVTLNVPAPDAGSQEPESELPTEPGDDLSLLQPRKLVRPGLDVP